MKRTLSRTLIIVACLIVGVIFFIIQRGLLIVEWAINPRLAQQMATTQQDVNAPKKVLLFYPKNNLQEKEESSLIWKENNAAENLKNLANHWIAFLQDEKVIRRNIVVEDVAISSVGQEAYISFDRSPLPNDWSTRKKWFLIDSFLKTIDASELGIKFVVLLVNQNPMEDDHLDFSQPLPVDGF